MKVERGLFLLKPRRVFECLASVFRKLNIKNIIGRYTLDPQEFYDFSLVQAVMGKNPISLSETQEIMLPEIIKHLENIVSTRGNKVYTHAGLTEYFNSNPNAINSIQQAIEKSYYIEIEDKEEVETLRHNLFNKLNEKSSYGCIGHTANYWYLCDYFGDSNYKIRAQIQIDGNEKFLNALENELRNTTFRSAEGFNRWFETFKSGKGKHYDGSSDATFRITNNGDVGMALSKLQEKNISDTGTSDEQSTRDNDFSGLTNSTAEDWNKDGAFFITPSGEVYGFVAPNGDIYLDETIISFLFPFFQSIFHSIFGSFSKASLYIPSISS